MVDGSRRGCAYDTHELAGRAVFAQVPVGEPPDAGWPAVILFHGSFQPAERSWEAREGDPWGAWHQIGSIEALLDAGFAVITPNAMAGTFWNTNVPPWSTDWDGAPDDRLVQALLAAVGDGTFGALDPDRLMAAGISSGGYMTSRMALSYPGAFQGLAVVSASWATCSGALCELPDALPADHPPTLFLHGERDVIVPPRTMHRYADALTEAGHSTMVITDPQVGHAWIPAAPDALVAWFDALPADPP